MRDREELIASLVDDLSAKPKQLPIMVLALIWWAVSWIYVVVTTLMIAPLRQGVHEELLNAPQFQVESLLGLVATLIFAVAAWYGSIPGALTRRLMAIGIGLAVVWVSFYVVGLWEPALPPSMHGKREHCYLDAFIHSVPPTLVACVYIAKRYPLKQMQTGLMIGLAAGMMPALFMQFACMYDPVHILRAHIFPGLLNGGIGIVLLPMVQHYVKRDPEEQ